MLLFFNTIPMYDTALVSSCQELKKLNPDREQDLEFTSKNEQTLPLLQYCGMCQDGTNSLNSCCPVTHKSVRQ
jgi:hypothetical protein